MRVAGSVCFESQKLTLVAFSLENTGSFLWESLPRAKLLRVLCETKDIGGRETIRAMLFIHLGNMCKVRNVVVALGRFSHSVSSV